MIVIIEANVALKMRNTITFMKYKIVTLPHFLRIKLAYSAFAVIVALNVLIVRFALHALLLDTPLIAVNKIWIYIAVRTVKGTTLKTYQLRATH